MVLVVNNLTYVNSGEIKFGYKKGILVSSPLGSCVAVTFFNISSKFGGMAHIMLPGKSDEGQTNFKYAKDAIEHLLSGFNKKKIPGSEISICIAGGANVLKKEHDKFPDYIVESVIKNLKDRNLVIKKASTGGFERRTLRLDLSNGNVFYTIGDSKQQILWKEKEFTLSQY